MRLGILGLLYQFSIQLQQKNISYNQQRNLFNKLHTLIFKLVKIYLQ